MSDCVVVGHAIIGFGVICGIGQKSARVDATLGLTCRKEKYCIVNFTHPDFARCRIMSDRLGVGTHTPSRPI